MKIVPLVGLVLCVSVGCGGGNESSETLTASASAPASATGSTSVRPVSFDTLESFLPALAGWTRGEARGRPEPGEPSEPVTRLTVNYERGPSTLSIELTDSAKDENVMALMREALKGQDPELKPATLAGMPAAEQWVPEVNRGLVHILVADRFMVAVTGESVSSLAEVRAAAEKIDLKKMAALK